MSDRGVATGWNFGSNYHALASWHGGVDERGELVEWGGLPLPFEV